MNQEWELFLLYTIMAINDLNREKSVFGIFFGYRKHPLLPPPWGMQTKIETIHEALVHAGAVALA